mmetsp:Transcript_110383/g.330130  ORF Transcript_110383/g.330130 Transcript_110383/m.330130 type:complete len:266 (+) Transcript_110383:194-991(+)
MKALRGHPSKSASDHCVLLLPAVPRGGWLWRQCCHAREHSDPALQNHVGDPPDGIAVTSLLQHAAHEDADRAARYVGRQEPQGAPELLLRSCALQVNLLAQHRDGHSRERLLAEKVPQLFGRLGVARPVESVHHEDDRAGHGEVLPPEAAARLVAGQVEGAKAHLTHHDLLRLRMERWLLRYHSVVLEHLKERCLTRIVEAQEKQAGIDRLGGHIEEALLLHCCGRQRQLRFIVRGRHWLSPQTPGRNRLASGREVVLSGQGAFA